MVLLVPSALPYIMALAGGAMIYTTVEEMPMMSMGKENDRGAFAFVAGFSIIMLLIFAS